MSDSKQALFVDLDPHTGQHTPTTYESMRATMLGRHHVPASVPNEVQGLLFAAIEYVALAYEQANSSRDHLFDLLTNDAFVKAALALELALRHRLGRGKRVTLENLILIGLAAGLLPDTDRDKEIWTELRANRNAIAHGDPDPSYYGPSTSRWIEFVIDAVNGMYAKEKVEPSPASTRSSD